MKSNNLDFAVSNLGEGNIPSSMSGVQFVDEQARVIYHSSLTEVNAILEADKDLPCFEMAGPRRVTYFDPSKLKNDSPLKLTQNSDVVND